MIDRTRSKPFFPPERKSQGRFPGKSNRVMLNVILYWLNTGISWRDLLECYDPWQSAYSRFHARTCANLWGQILDDLIAQ